MPIRAPKVIKSAAFDKDVADLRSTFEHIERVIDELEEALVAAWNVPHMPVDEKEMPGVYSVLLDYPPFGPDGLSALMLTYHATPLAANPMSEPLRTYTLLTLTLA